MKGEFLIASSCLRSWWLVVVGDTTDAWEILGLMLPALLTYVASIVASISLTNTTSVLIKFSFLAAFQIMNYRV